MKARKQFTKRVLSIVLSFVLMLACVPFVYAMDAGEDFTITATDSATVLVEGTDYTYTDGVLTVSTSTPVTIGMANGVSTTADVIVTDSTNGAVNITFNGISIDTEEHNAIELKGQNQTTFVFSGTNAIISAYSGIEMEKTPLEITSFNSGYLSIKDIKFGITSTAYTAGATLKISGNIGIDIQNCSSHAIFNKENSVSISGTPNIYISANEYALYGIGVDISGGDFTIYNNDGYAICSGGSQPLTLSGNADLHIKNADSGIYASKSKLTITDSVKLKVYGGSNDNRTAGIKEYALNSADLLIEKNAFVDLFCQEDAIACDVTNITDDAQVYIDIKCERDYSQSAISFDETLNIQDRAVVDIDVLSGSKIYGLYDLSGTVNISGSAYVSIDGAYRSVYADYLNLSNNASLTIENDLNYAVYGVTTISDSATLTAASLEKKVLYDSFTVKPAQDKVYMVQTGASVEEAETEYYTEETTESEKSTWRYFSAKIIDGIPVNNIGTDKEITYDGNAIDLRTLFTVDENAGAASWWIVEATGAGSLDTQNPWEYEITEVGTFKVMLRTQANGVYAAGEATATLTVKKGTGTGTVSVANWIYGDTANTPQIRSDTHDNIHVTCFYESTDGKDYASSAVPTNAGSYKLTVTFGENNLYDVYTAETTFTIGKKELTASVTGTAIKNYDGTTSVPADNSLGIILDGVVINDDISATAVYAYDNADAGTTRVNATDITLIGAAKENYKLASATASGNVGKIAPKNLEEVNITLGEALLYNGKEQTQSIEVGGLDGLTVTYIVSGDKATAVGVYELTVTGVDNFSGNKTIRYTVAPDTSKIQGVTTDNVTSDNKKDIETLKDSLVNAELKLATEEEKNKVQEIIDKCDELLATLESTGNSINTENIEKVKDVTSENVTPENKTDLEKAKADLEKALENNGDNYTDNEKKSINDEMKRIDDALKVIKNIEAVEELIDKLPETITKNDGAAIKTADDAYNALSDYEKSLVNEEAKKALDDAKATFAELSKPVDAGSPNTGDNSNLWLWLAFLFVSGTGIFGVILCHKKNTERTSQ